MIIHLKLETLIHAWKYVQIYVVYMGALPPGQISPKSHQLSILEQALQGRSVEDSLLYSYKRSFNGFAAKLTPQEKHRLASMQGVVGVFESKSYQLHTTRSWDFMGFPTSVNRNLMLESDVIIGMLDTGAWPESESFKDHGMGPPPKKWKGTCQTAGNFTCNNKLIGARFYPTDAPSANDSARDTEGHGSHTASTAAGREVKNASFFGLAQGLARGAVPSARLAIYKVCWPSGCFDHAILAAFDDAISDGVDLLSVSLGPDSTSDYGLDPLAIGAFHAMRNGILMVQSAGNSGPDPKTLGSVAPWILTVAASSTDRRIISKVQLGDGNTLVGNAVNTFDLGGKMHPLIYAVDASSNGCEGLAEACLCLERNKTQGKIVVCDEDQSQGSSVLSAGALGMLAKAQDENTNDVSFIYPLPSSILSANTTEMVKSYINSTKEPQANILKSEAFLDSAAPVTVSFSSRGPNTITKDLLKPDISAPGVDILAAFSPVASLSRGSQDTRFTKYTILSGTSMACPHAAGAAAYVKSFHPNWSPAAIKSALMTTASPMNGNKNAFDYGAGHMNPVKAIDPGLVYDAQEGDYIEMLCSEGYNRSQLELITGHKANCSATGMPAKDLNYPSMTASLGSAGPFAVNFTRTVTNVGSASSTYQAKLEPKPEFEVSTIPSKLTFKALGEKMTFVVRVRGALKNDQGIFGTSIVWSDGTHNVKSPIVVCGMITSEVIVCKLHTTRSWDFMDFPTSVARNLVLESDVIIGMIDAGAWPESESFKDDGMGPPPKKWKGTCQTAGNFTCNKYCLASMIFYSKLIGARFYPIDAPSANDSARDTHGHRIHTASTAAGREVKNASFYGLAQGIARGAVPSARVAVYKVCWPEGCYDHSILAAFDDAISDGVDLLSASLGGLFSFHYHHDVLAIGAFHAMRNGILVLQSAGNGGHSYPQSLSSVAPWILTVAASTTDRRIINKVQLGNGDTIVGYDSVKVSQAHQLQPDSSPNHIYWRGSALIPTVTVCHDYNVHGPQGNGRNNLGSGGS
ncbi:hypothetical protein ACLOJK_012581 [Asimina triloba]